VILLVIGVIPLLRPTEARPSPHPMGRAFSFAVSGNEAHSVGETPPVQREMSLLILCRPGLSQPDSLASIPLPSRRFRVFRVFRGFTTVPP
jgi:hypothetical protein